MSNEVQIQAIDKTSVHRICSGQVILNLASAVKELVENSLDAGSNSIEIRVKEYGIKSLEVIDNGSGVEESNYEGLGLKHHTSKLRQFNDLTLVDTFGFRGEALSSLCALGKVTITTKQKDAQNGHRIEFDHHGLIAKKTVFPRQVGTTVQIQDLFSTLPVRHKEFIRNAKKDFAKMTQVLTAYCLVSTGVKLQCSHVNDKGRKTMILNTTSNDSVKDNITNIFGPKEVDSLHEFEQILPSQDACEELNTKPTDFVPFKIRGYVSSCEHGKGRSCSDRQFLFINKRPCDMPKLTRIINDTYHHFNRHQYPFFMLEISMEKDSVDINVTPDKRQIFIDNQKLLMATVKTSLLRMFEPQASTFRLQNVVEEFKSTESSKVDATVGGGKKLFDLSKIKRTFSSAFAPKNDVKLNKSMSLDTFFSASKRPRVEYGGVVQDAGETTSTRDDMTSLIMSQSECDVVDGGQLQLCDESFNETKEDVDPLPQIEVPILRPYVPENIPKIEEYQTPRKYSPEPEVSHHVIREEHVTSPAIPEVEVIEIEPFERTLEMPECSRKKESVFEPKRESDMNYDLDLDPDSPRDLDLRRGNPGNSPELERNSGDLDPNVDEAFDVSNRRTLKVKFSLDQLKKKYGSKGVGNDENSPPKERKFRAKINPNDNSQAESELQKIITKEMFQKMDVLGQFNLGFIIAKLDRDLFIIDQHASDEKFNFEQLQKTTVLEGQKLIVPQNLQLSIVNETLLLDSLEIFRKNGFEFEISSENKVKLTSAPVSRNWQFGKRDIDEMLFMLMENPGLTCRPSRIRDMFASRACRKAIMIGTALSEKRMKNVLEHMSEMDQPWNCPHGRPTMRHLINLDMIMTS